MKIDAHEFLKVTEQPLRSGDATALAETVRRRWELCELCPLLEHREVDVRRVAAITLGLVGDGCVIGCLARALHDSDEQVNEMAEHALWSIWSRSGNARAAAPFQAGVDRLSEERYPEAISAFHRALQADPDFAEAYNQCSLAHFFQGELDACICDCQATLARMPLHFGAMAGLGHAYTHLGRLREATACYQKALTINPRMPGIRDALNHLENNAAPPSAGPDANADLTHLRD